jgi:DNA-binding NarL/FixJ family response regulator
MAPKAADKAPIGPTTVACCEQEEVIVLVAYKLTNCQIAQELYLSERTIENHLSKILCMLDLASRTEIAAWATEKSSLPPAPTRRLHPPQALPAPRSLQPNASAKSRK